ncbi:Phosphatidic acid phosphatase type 2 domain containing protein [Entamoeba marina]
MNTAIKTILQIFLDVVYIAFTGILALIFHFIPGFHMYVPDGSENVNVKYPYRVSTFPEVEAAFIIYVPVIIVILLFQIRRPSLRHLLFSYISLIASITTWFMFVEGGKKYAGRPRPNAYALMEEGNYDDAWKSFPSGHSAASWSGCVFASLYIAGELRVFSVRSEMWRLIPVIVPLILAGIICISRTRDYYHNFSDILGGSLIGMASSMMVYFSKFESLTSLKSGEIRGVERNPVSREVDEELEERREILGEDMIDEELNERRETPREEKEDKKSEKKQESTKKEQKQDKVSKKSTEEKVSEESHKDL